MSPKVAEADAAAAPAGAAAPQKSGKLVLIVGIVSLLIAAQAVITWLLMPKPVDPKASAAASASKDNSQENRGEDPVDESSSDSTEVKIGDFNCTNSTAAPGVVVQVDFKLSAVTTNSQSSTLSEQLKAHDARVRQIVNKIIRSSNLEDLNDPNLGTLKRLIREEVNRLLRKSLIAEVVISDIRTMEQ